MQLTDKQKRKLRGLAHSLKPVVLIGANGYTDPVRAEINAALEHHELIKVRVNAEDRDERGTMIEQICSDCRCTLVQRVGHIATLFRRNQRKPIISLKDC